MSQSIIKAEEDSISNSNHELQQVTEEYKYKIPEDYGQTFEEYFSKDNEQIQYSGRFLYEISRTKANKCFHMINDLVINDDLFNFLRLKGREQAIISILTFENCSADKVQSFFGELKTFVKGQSTLFLEYIFQDIILDKSIHKTCHLYTIKPLCYKISDLYSNMMEDQQKSIEKFIQQIYEHVQKNQSLGGLNMMLYIDIMDYIVITENNQLKFDYIYFLEKEFIPKNQTGINSSFIEPNQQKNSPDITSASGYYSQQDIQSSEQENVDSIRSQNEIMLKRMWNSIIQSYSSSNISNAETNYSESSMITNVNLKELVYQKCKQNILNQITKFCSKLESTKLIDERLQRKSRQGQTCEINQNVYLSFVSLAKKIFYKHILKSILVLYEESPFYYKYFMDLQQNIKDDEEEFLQNNLHNFSEYSKLVREQDKSILGDIKYIQLSLKEYFTKSIMENPIRFISCSNHIECFDQTSLDYLINRKKCPECHEYFGEYYEDEYLRFILNFVTVQQNENLEIGIVDLDNYEDREINPYSIESVNCCISNGIFLPIIDWVDTEFLQVKKNRPQKNQPQIFNFIDLEYLYQISKNNTFEKEDNLSFQLYFIREYQPKIRLTQFSNNDPATLNLHKLFNPRKFIEYPVRNCSKSCNHPSCFDISDLIEVNKPHNFTNNFIICPICHSTFFIEDLVYDKEYMNLINLAKTIQIEESVYQQENNFQLGNLNSFQASIDFKEDKIMYLDNYLDTDFLRFNKAENSSQSGSISNSFKKKKLSTEKGISGGNINFSDFQNEQLQQQVIESANYDSEFINNIEKLENLGNYLIGQKEVLDKLCIYQQVKRSSSNNETSSIDKIDVPIKMDSSRTIDCFLDYFDSNSSSNKCIQQGNMKESDSKKIHSEDNSPASRSESDKCNCTKSTFENESISTKFYSSFD